MAPPKIDSGAVPEVEVTITWRQWPDGRWEAWIDDGSGQPPRHVRGLAELVRCLKQVSEDSEPPH